MPKEICCINFKGLFAYLSKNYGEDEISIVLNGLVDNHDYLIHDLKDPFKVFPIGREQLVDPAYWVSNEYSLKLFHNVKKIVKDTNPLFVTGRGAVRESLSKSALFIGKLFGPSFLAKQAAKINSRFNKTKQVLPIIVNERKINVKLLYHPTFRITKDVCNWNLGIYYELMNMAGVAGVKAYEVRCVLNGDENCEFELSWKTPKSVKNFFNSISIWPVKSEVKAAIAEFEDTLKQRDSLIDELIGSEQKYRSVFENTSTANAIVETDSSIVMVNSEFEKLTGLSKTEIEHKTSLKSFIALPDHKVIDKYLGTICDDIQCPSANIEFRIVSRNGSGKYVLCKMGRIPKTNNLVVSIMDVTESKRAQIEKEELELKLLKAEKMEAVGNLAGSVAHDLNNILSGIVSYPELLLMQLPEESPFRKPLKTIQESGNKAAAIVQDMLTMARRGVVIKEVINVNDIVKDYLKSPEFEKLISYHTGVNVVFNGAKNLKYIHGSPFHLAKVVMNLVSNAAEAMPNGGRIVISTENISLNEPCKGYELIQIGDYVALTVEDYGTGISPADIEHIFEPFYTKKVMGRSGTGLGMAVVLGTVKDQKGFIDVQSTIGKGTCFKLYFPSSNDIAGKKEPIKNKEIFRGKGESILVVDDMKEQLEIAGKILTELGYRVMTAQSGEKAIEYLKINSVDLVILDMIMDPGIDGHETYSRIRKMIPSQKAIIASGYSESNRLKQTQQIGAIAYIRKPYSIETIAKAVYIKLKNIAPSQCSSI
jgi:PAS domain S-box-containing protein